MVIRAVIFDFGGTLAEGSMNWDEYHAAILRLLRGRGYDVEMTRFRKAIDASLVRLESVRSGGMEMRLEEVYSHALSMLGICPDDDLLRAIHDLFRMHFKTTFYPCVEDVLKQLSTQYRLAVLSNTMSDTPRIVLQEKGLIGYFDLVVCSSDLGIRKPDPRIFQYVLDKLGVAAGEAVHVGDEVETDVAGATEAGIRAILVKRSEDSAWSGPTIRSLRELPRMLSEIDRRR
jgi:putative hydrolase of the HAD superfamily